MRPEVEKIWLANSIRSLFDERLKVNSRAGKISQIIAYAETTRRHKRVRSRRYEILIVVNSKEFVRHDRYWDGLMELLCTKVDAGFVVYSQREIASLQNRHDILSTFFSAGEIIYTEKPMLTG